jgi:hypothetical protein
MMKTLRITTWLVAVLVMLGSQALTSAVWAEDKDAKAQPGSGSTSAKGEPDLVKQHGGAADLAVKLSNPVSNVWNITTQSNWSFYEGKLSPDYRMAFTFNFQPVCPIPLTEKWTLIPRPVIPIKTSPFPRGFEIRADGFLQREPVGLKVDWSRDGGIGDISFMTLLSPKIPGVIFGAGPTFVFPTATSKNLGQGKVQVGPAVVLGFITKNKKWLGLVFPQHWWSVSGSPRRPPTSQTNIQYVLYRFFHSPSGTWQVGFQPNITINWRAKPGNEVTFPIGIGVGKTVKFGKAPVQMILEFDWAPWRPDDFGQVFNIRLQVKPVIPSLIKKPIFGK